MTKKKPLIALTPYFNIERDEPYMRPTYLNAIRAAGGTPLILPLDLEDEDLQQVVDTFDGFLKASHENRQTSFRHLPRHPATECGAGR